MKICACLMGKDQIPRRELVFSHDRNKLLEWCLQNVTFHLYSSHLGQMGFHSCTMLSSKLAESWQFCMHLTAKNPRSLTCQDVEDEPDDITPGCHEAARKSHHRAAVTGCSEVTMLLQSFRTNACLMAKAAVGFCHALSLVIRSSKATTESSRAYP